MGRNKNVRSSSPAPTDRPTSTRPVPLAPPPRRPAVFLDRDGTIINDAGYIDDPKKVELLPGAATAIARLRDAGYLAVIVSNQSGVARGKFDEAKMNEVHGRVVEVLGECGATIDGAYHCPYLSGESAVVERYRRDSPMRKPNPGMLLEASRAHGIDLSRSWMIGDKLSDVAAGRAAGCRTILVGVLRAEGDAPPTMIAKDLAEAAIMILEDAGSSKPQSTDAPRAEQETDTPKTNPSPEIKPNPPAEKGDPRSTPSHGDAAPPDRTVLLLTRIHELLDRAARRSSQDDFSVVRLFGALIQMLAIAAAVWGSFSLLSDDPLATPRLTFACFLQLAALTAFSIDRRG